MDSSSFESITEEMLQSLIDNKAVENLQLEFKGYCFENGKVTDKQKTDILKEIAAFSNAYGGQIIIGIEEEKGIASKLQNVGCSPEDFDGIQLAIQQAMLAKVRPRIYGITMERIEVAEDMNAIIINVPKSFNRPHAVNEGGKDSFFIRHSNGVIHMSVDDLRKQFIYSASFKYDMRNFRQERIGMILGNECIGNLVDGAKVLLHIVPLWSLDVGNSIDIKQLQHLYSHKIRPISGSGWYHRYNSDGYCVSSKAPNEENTVNTYVQVFRNGLIEALDIRLMNYNGQFQGQVYDWRQSETSVYKAIKRYTDLLRELNIPKPWYIFVSLLNAKGFRSDSFYFGTSESIDRDIIHATECVWDDDNRTLGEILKPTLDSLANAFGMPESPNYDKQGNYREE